MNIKKPTEDDLAGMRQTIDRGGVAIWDGRTFANLEELTWLADVTDRQPEKEPDQSAEAAQARDLAARLSEPKPTGEPQEHPSLAEDTGEPDPDAKVYIGVALVNTPHVAGVPDGIMHGMLPIRERTDQVSDKEGEEDAPRPADEQIQWPGVPTPGEEPPEGGYHTDTAQDPVDERKEGESKAKSSASTPKPLPSDQQQTVPSAFGAAPLDTTRAPTSTAEISPSGSGGKTMPPASTPTSDVKPVSSDEEKKRR